MKWLFRLILWIVGIGVIFYGLKNIPIENILQGLANRSVYVERNGQRFLPDWKKEEVLDDINAYRRQEGLTEVTINQDLDSAALSRLSVILTEEDYLGDKTGLTREVAVKNADYEASTIGDLVLLSFFKTNDPVSFWLTNEVTKETLLNKDFKDVGIAIKNEDERVNVYVLLVSPQEKRVVAPKAKNVTWGGPQLWDAVNRKRVEMGVNPLQQRDELCTIASIRLNELLELGKLDGHAGFVPVLDRPDLKWISEKYNISEYLAQGYQSPADTVSAWENTLGHRTLLAGGEYVWGCVYSQNTFAVAIAAY